MLNLWRLEGGFLDVLKTNPLPQHAAREIRQENEREALFRAPHTACGTNVLATRLYRLEEIKLPWYLTRRPRLFFSNKTL
jgi:hypothetical protein